MNRIVVVGSSGSGKSTLSRGIAAALSLPLLELDSVRHRAGWNSVDGEQFSDVVDGLAAGDRWVIDGNYTSLGTRKKVWPRADTIVWLDPPRWRALTRVVRRTVKRLLTRERLWGAVTEPWSNIYSRDPYKNIILWTWTNYAHVKDKYEKAIERGEWGHATVYRLSSPREVKRFVKAIGGK